MTGEFAGRPFQRGDDRKGLLKILDRQLRHHRTAIGDKPDIAFRGKHLEGLANRCSGHAEALRQRFFRHLAARFQITIDDHLAQPVGQLHGERRAG